MNRIAAVLLLITLGFSFSGCKKDDQDEAPAQTTRLDVRLADESGSPISNVEVKLYRTREDWAAEQNVAHRAITSGNGKALFLYLDASEYFANAATADKSNWEGNIRLTNIARNQNSTAEINVVQNKSRLLSRAEGKTWRIISYVQNGQEFTTDTTKRCLTDNQYTFYKGQSQGKFALNESGLVCQPGTPPYQEGSWDINPAGTVMNLTLGAQQQSYTLMHLSATTLRLRSETGSDITSITLTSN